MSAKVSFKITTYFKRPRSEGGRTATESHRLDIGAAIGWLLAELPDGSHQMTHEGKDGTGAAKTTIVIDWTKVPAEIKDGLS